MVVCCQCDALVKTSSLHSHLADQHDTYPVVVVPVDYLESRAGVTYQAHPKYNGKLPCPVAECSGELKDGCMLHHHFWDLHLLIRLLSQRRATSPAASGAGCRLTLCTHLTSGQRNGGSGLTNGSSRSQLSPWPSPCGASLMSMDLFWSALRFSSTSVACLRRMTMMQRPSGSKCGRPGEFGLV